MGITPRFKPSDIKAKLQAAVAKIDNLIISELSRLGEECVNMSRQSIAINPSAFPITIDGKTGKPLQQRKITERDKAKRPDATQPVFGDYLDQTANLRGSIGYSVIKDGRVVKGHGEGGSKTEALIGKIASKPKFINGIGLIVVAGMDYAAAVEAKGYNVISSAELYAKQKLPGIKERVTKIINKMK